MTFWLAVHTWLKFGTCLTSSPATKQLAHRLVYLVTEELIDVHRFKVLITGNMVPPEKACCLCTWFGRVDGRDMFLAQAVPRGGGWCGFKREGVSSFDMNRPCWTLDVKMAHDIVERYVDDPLKGLDM